jgi:hypothetical protein
MEGLTVIFRLFVPASDGAWSGGTLIATSTLPDFRYAVRSASFGTDIMVSVLRLGLVPQ